MIAFKLYDNIYNYVGASPDDISNARNANHELNEEYTSTDHDLGEVDCGVDPLYDIDRSLFEYVRMELKHKLKDVRRGLITPTHNPNAIYNSIIYG